MLLANLGGLQQCKTSRQSYLCVQLEVTVLLPIQALFHSSFSSFSLFFWATPCGMRDLSSQPGIEPIPSAFGGQSLNHQTAREGPTPPFILICCCTLSPTWFFITQDSFIFFSCFEIWAMISCSFFLGSVNQLKMISTDSFSFQSIYSSSIPMNCLCPSSFHHYFLPQMFRHI